MSTEKVHSANKQGIMFYLVSKTEGLSPGGSLSDSSKDSSKEVRKEPRGSFANTDQVKAVSIRRLQLIKESSI